MTASLARLANAALFALQLLANAKQNAFSPSAEGERFASDSPLRPAAFAFLIWPLIYVFVALLVTTDVLRPHLTFYARAHQATLLRACFATSCVANMLWIALFNWLRLPTVAALDLALLWLALLPLYLFVNKTSETTTRSWTQFVLSELAVRLYFSWVSVAALLNVAIAAQSLHGGFLSLGAYIVLLAVLVVLVLAGVVYGHDPVIGFVGVWALVALAVRSDGAFDGDTQEVFAEMQACATLGVSLVAAFLAVAALRAVVFPRQRCVMGYFRQGKWWLWSMDGNVC